MILKTLIAAALMSTSIATFAAPITSKTDVALNGAQVIDFETSSAGSFSSFIAGGVTFSTPENGKKIHISNAYSGQYGAIGKSIQNTYNSNAFGILDFSFLAPVSAFAFNWGASNSQWTLRAWDVNDNLLDTVLPAITVGSNDGYTGIKFASALISRAQLSGPSSDYIFLDNFSFAADTISPVPEPEQFAMFGLGLGLLAFMRKRKRRV